MPFGSRSGLKDKVTRSAIVSIISYFVYRIIQYRRGMRYRQDYTPFPMKVTVISFHIYKIRVLLNTMMNFSPKPAIHRSTYRIHHIFLHAHTYDMLRDVTEGGKGQACCILLFLLASACGFIIIGIFIIIYCTFRP